LGSDGSINLNRSAASLISSNLSGSLTSIASKAVMLMLTW